MFWVGARIVVCGLSISSAWGNGHATLLRGLFGALGRAGHEVIFLERDVGYYARHRDLGRTPGYRLILYQSWPEAEALLTGPRGLLGRADVAMVTSYCPD